MGAAAQRRGGKVIREQIDRELEAKRGRNQICGGTYSNGPDKRFTRCGTCGDVNFEANEGDRCPEKL